MQSCCSPTHPNPESGKAWLGKTLQKNGGVGNKAELERVMGIEPTTDAWEASVLPLNYTRPVGEVCVKRSRSRERGSENYSAIWWLCVTPALSFSPTTT